MSERKTLKAVNKLKTLASNPELYKNNKICGLFQGGVIHDQFIDFIKKYTGDDISEYKDMGLIEFLSLFNHDEPEQKDLEVFTCNNQLLINMNFFICGKPIRIGMGINDKCISGFSVTHRDDFYNSY